MHLQQVFMNLVVNAMEALSEMPHGAPRTLLVTSKYDADNNQAVIIFKDNGPALPMNIRPRSLTRSFRQNRKAQA